MARVSIYVPDDLKVRMDKAGDAINWSEVARPAFLSAIANHEHREGKSMTTAIERLRASKDKYLERVLKDGIEAGRQWARDQAEFDELRNVARLHESEYGVEASALKKAIDPDDDHSWKDFAEYLGLEPEEFTDEYAQAFAEGAADVWGDVKDEL